MKNGLSNLSNKIAEKNFGFFEYRYALSETKKAEFLQDCQAVIESDHATKLEELKLALRLFKLKESGAWKEVINPDNGQTFLYTSFEAFSDYAFGFGSTRTSNLLSLSQFVYWDEGTGCLLFKAAKYASMNVSKLIELAPLPESHREYFRSDMTVRDIRFCKKYISDGRSDFYERRYDDEFDLLASAKAWQEQSERKKELETAKSVDEELKKTAFRNASFALGADPDVSDYMQSVYERERSSEQALENPTSELEEAIEEPKHRFSSREGVRRFLADYQSWQSIALSGDFFDSIKRYRFKNGVELFAARCKICVNAHNVEDKPLLFFFLSLGAGIQPIKVSKLKLEIWLRENEAALLGVTV